MRQLRDTLSRQHREAELEAERLKLDLEHESKRNKQLKANYDQLKDKYDSSLQNMKQDYERATDELARCKLERDRALGEAGSTGRALEAANRERERLKGEHERAVERVLELNDNCARTVEEGGRKTQEMEEELGHMKKTHDQERTALR